MKREENIMVSGLLKPSGRSPKKGEETSRGIGEEVSRVAAFERDELKYGEQ